MGAHLHGPGWGYLAIMVGSIVAALACSRWINAPSELRTHQRIAIGLGAFIGAMIGAKLPFLFQDYEALVSGAAWFSDGKTIMFGLVGGYGGVEIAKGILQIRVKTGDRFAVPVAVAVGIGRLGCLHAGCCFGTPTGLPWGMSFAGAGDHLARHPTQIYESIFHLGAAVVLLTLLRKGLLRGQLIKLYIMSYMSYRFITEWIRPEPDLWLGLTFYQWSALVFVPLFGLLWRRDARRLRWLEDLETPLPTR
jgi:phosphatidylglycerol:prolipoprotein diacylglycerol transferase